MVTKVSLCVSKDMLEWSLTLFYGNQTLYPAGKGIKISGLDKYWPGAFKPTN